MMIIDRYAYFNKLKNVHPLEKFLFSILTLLICVIANSIAVSVITIIIMAFITVKKAGTARKFYFKLMLIPLYFLIIGTAAIAVNPLPPSNIAIVSCKIFNITLGITKYSFLMAIKTFLKAFAAVCCLYFLALTTSMVDIISILRKFKTPELFIELMGLIYRFIFILIESSANIINSQTARLGYINIKKTFNSLGILFSNLFIFSYKKANNLYTALESRNYTGKMEVLENHYEFSNKNLFLIFTIEIMLLIISVLFKS